MRNPGPTNQCRILAVVLPLVLLLFLPLDAKGETGVTSCAMVPLWSPQAQFAGYYMALEKGFYRTHGIDMTILKGGPGYSGGECLKDGRADFAILWLASAMRQSSEGPPLVHLGQIIPRSSMMLVAKKSRCIDKPFDMNGKTVGLWGGDLAIPPQAFLKKHGLQVKEIPQSYTVNLFLRGGVDVASAMWYNEYHTILNSGIDPEELSVFSLSDYGVSFPEDGLYMLQSSYKKNPALAVACVKASLEGWRYAFEHPEEALEIVIRHMCKAKICANRAHQRWMLARMQDLIMPVLEEGDFGCLKRPDFDSVSAFLLESGLTDETPDYDHFIGEIHVEH